MHQRTSWMAWFLTVLILSTAIGESVTFAQEATPAASPVASPAGAACTPGPSKTSAEIRAEIEKFYPIEQPENTEGTYVTSSIGDLESLNPYILESDPSSAGVGYVFEALFGSDPRTGQPVPGGVTDWWEVAEDCVTYTLHLRRDKLWHDGEDMTAADVAFSFEALADESLASPYTGQFRDTVASWNVIDDDTIQVVSNGLRADFLHFASQFIIPKHIWEDIPRDQWATDPGSTGQDPSRVIGTGAFKFERWTHGQEIRLVRNEQYTPFAPWAKEIIIRIFADGEARLNAFLTGDIDYIELEPQHVETVKGEGDKFKVVERIPGLGFLFYAFNLNPETTVRFQDVRVRQAFMYALDRQSILDNILLGYGEVAIGTQPTISYAYAPDQITTKYTYDPQKAIGLLAEAGWADTNGNGIVDKDGVEMEFEFLYPSGLAVLDTLLAYLQDTWKAVGISISPVALEFPALIDATSTNPTFEMMLAVFGWDTTFFQDVMFACDMHQVGFNFMKYCNPELDGIGEQIHVTLDQDERVPLMIGYSNVVNDEQPVGIIWFTVTNAAYATRMHNTFPGPWGGPGIAYLWLEE